LDDLKVNLQQIFIILVNYPFNGQEELSIKLQLAVSQNAQPSTLVRSETQSA